MIYRHPESGALTGIAKSILTSLGTALALAILGGAWSIYTRFHDLDQQMRYFHGDWPPEYAGPPR